MTKTFSWKAVHKAVLKSKLRRAEIMAKNKVNPDFNIRHPSEIREYATKKSFTELHIRIKNELIKYQDVQQQRADKIKPKI